MLRPLSAGLLLVAATLPLTAQSSGPRDRAMGGAGVASSKPFNAPFVNPALLTGASDALDVGLVVPFVEALGRDEDELVDAVEAFQDTLEQIQAFIDAGDFVSANNLRPTLANQLSGLDGRMLDVDADVGVSVVLPVEPVRLGVSFRSYVDGRAFPVVDPADIVTINDPMSTSADLDNLQSEAVLIAAGVAEVGFTAAFETSLVGLPLSIGVTPKFQSVETFNYARSVVDFEDDDAFSDFDDEIYRQSDENFNLDAGVSMNVTPMVTAGLALTNIFENSYDTVATGGRTFTYDIEPRATAGVALRGAGFTVTGDLDLTKTTRFAGVAESQFARVGAEYDLSGWLQLRAGFAHDLEDMQQDVLSAGLGISPFEVVRFDVVGLLGDNAYGAGFQLSVTL